jgi:membrane protease YdiL (CAAX protease family)
MSNVSSDEPVKKPGFPARGPQVPWGPAAAILIAIVALVGAQLFASELLLFIAKAFEVAGADRAAWPTSTVWRFGFVFIADAIILSVLWFFLRSRRASWRLLGFSRRPTWRDAGLALGLFLIYMLLLYVVSSAAELFTPINVQQRQELGFDDLAAPSSLLLGFIALVVLPPIVEEIVFRGFVFTGLRTKLPFIGAAIFTSLLFAWPHLFASSEGLLWIAGIDTLLLSLILCYLREKTGALWAPIAVHVLKNGIAYLLLISITTS